MACRHPAPAPIRPDGHRLPERRRSDRHVRRLSAFFEVDGKRYAHLLDPGTGYPADHTQAVTVLIPTGPRAGTLSDATSKPVFIAGPEHWREMARKMDVGLVLRVDRDNHIFVTEALRQRLEFIGNTPEMTVVP